MKKIIASAFLIVLMAGCTNLPADPAKMSPEQLREWAKDKNANISCGIANTPWGKGVGVYVVLDKAVVVSGTVTVDDQCKVTITNSPVPKP